MDVTPRIDALPEIRRLPALVAAQIAAGEVVERPASVVKELLDNALDAGATRIGVELEQGGIELVRVSDNGHGMTSAQLPMALAEHATSKIRDASDLDRVTTMGFRGEALASIASVARVSIRSRCAAESSASVIEGEGGVYKDVRPEAGPVGTCVSVRNLFFNTPARRKFLKTPATEQGHCVDVVRALALSHPDVGFVLKADGRVVLDVAQGQGPRDRALAVLGREMESQYVEVHADQFDDVRGLSLWGLVGRPSLARPTIAGQHLFVNGRPVRDKTITHALKEAFRGLIEPTRHPAAVLMIVMDPGAVDVNVHPAKAEVRFRDGGVVHATVYRAVREALQGADVTPAAAPSWGAVSPRGIGGDSGGGAAGGASNGASMTDRFVEYFKQPAPAAGGRFDYPSVREGVGTERAGPGQSGSSADVPNAMELPRPIPAQRALQVHNSFIVTQDEEGVLIIDQHALHERIMFERIKERLSRGDLESQRLLMPAVVSVPGQRIELLGVVAGLCKRLGIVAEAMGPTSVGVHAFPTFLFDKKVDPASFVSELLEKAEQQKWEQTGVDASVPEDLLHEILDMMACKAAIKAGDALSEGELVEMLELRAGLERASNCPHGRPTTIRVTVRDLERLFGRG